MYVSYNNDQVDFDECVQFMDDEIREKLHMEIGGCTEQEFLDGYCKAHEEKYGEDFAI